MYKFQMVNVINSMELEQGLRAKVLEVINNHNSGQAFNLSKLKNYISDNNVSDGVSSIVYACVQKVNEHEINLEAIETVVNSYKSHSDSSIIRNWYRELINNILTSLVVDNTKSFKLYPVSVGGRGKHTHYNDRTYELLKVLKKLNIKYETGNDSARNGKLSSFVAVKIDKRNSFIKELLTEFEKTKKEVKDSYYD